MSKFTEFLGNAADVGKSISSIISPVSGITSAIKGIGSLFGIGGGKSDEELMREQAKLQYEYQTKLNEQQQEFARENAATEYERAREMTSDKYLLDKQGRRAAGMSVAMGEGTSVAGESAPNIASPYAGSAGLAAPNIATDRQYKQMESLNAVSQLLSNNAIAVEQKKSLELDNQLKLQTLSSKIRKEAASAKSEEQRANMLEFANFVEQSFGYSDRQFENEMKRINAKYLESEKLADLETAKAYIQQLISEAGYNKARVKFLKKQEDEIDAKIDLYKSQKAKTDVEAVVIPRVANSEIYRNTAQGHQAGAQANLIGYQETYLRMTEEQRKEVQKNEAVQSFLNTLSKSPREALLRWLQKPDNDSIWKIPLWIVTEFLQVLDGAAGAVIAATAGGVSGAAAAAANKAAKKKMQNNFNPYSDYDSTY